MIYVLIAYVVCLLVKLATARKQQSQAEMM